GFLRTAPRLPKVSAAPDDEDDSRRRGGDSTRLRDGQHSGVDAAEDDREERGDVRRADEVLQSDPLRRSGGIAGVSTVAGATSRPPRAGELLPAILRRAGGTGQSRLVDPDAVGGGRLASTEETQPRQADREQRVDEHRNDPGNHTGQQETTD